jgi:C-terminal domain found in long catalases
VRNDGGLTDFLSDQYRHCKPIVVLGDYDILVDAKVAANLPGGAPDPGVAIMKTLDIDALCELLAGRRYFDREQSVSRNAKRGLESGHESHSDSTIAGRNDTAPRQSK